MRPQAVPAHPRHAKPADHQRQRRFRIQGAQEGVVAHAPPACRVHVAGQVAVHGHRQVVDVAHQEHRPGAGALKQGGAALVQHLVPEVEAARRELDEHLVLVVRSPPLRHWGLQGLQARQLLQHPAQQPGPRLHHGGAEQGACGRGPGPNRAGGHLHPAEGTQVVAEVLVGLLGPAVHQAVEGLELPSGPGLQQPPRIGLHPLLTRKEGGDHSVGPFEVHALVHASAPGQVLHQRLEALRLLQHALDRLVTRQGLPVSQDGVELHHALVGRPHLHLFPLVGVQAQVVVSVPGSGVKAEAIEGSPRSPVRW